MKLIYIILCFFLNLKLTKLHNRIMNGEQKAALRYSEILNQIDQIRK